MTRKYLGAPLFAVLNACGGTTGGDVVDFPAAAAGPPDIAPDVALEFLTDRDWHVVLATTTLHIGAVYLIGSMPVSGVGLTDCILPGTYVAQVTEGLDVNLLSPALQPFPVRGRGTTSPALAGQVWLTTGDVDDVNASPAAPSILHVEGTADRGADVRPFVGTITISNNRQAAQAGQTTGTSPICKQRIVSPIPVSVAVLDEGGLVVRVDPRVLFVNVDFGQLPRGASGYAFSDDPTDTDPSSPSYYSQPSANLYRNLHASLNLYSFSWDPSL